MLRKLSYKYIIINVWCVYNLILYFLASNFPYWENVALISWINSSAYFLLFLISIFIVFRDEFNRDIFINLSCTFILYSIVIFTIFIGSKYLFGDNILAYKIYPVKKILLHFLTTYSLFFISLKYILKKTRGIIVFLLSLSISLGVVFTCFHNFLIDSSYIFRSQEAFKVLHRGDFIVYALMLIPIIMYATFLYRYDRPNGEYLNLVMVGFLFFTVTGLVESAYQFFGGTDHANSQIILLIVLCVLFIILIKKLNYTYSAFGKFYERILFKKDYFTDIKLLRRGQSKISFFHYFYHYFSCRKIEFSTSIIISLFCINISGIPIYIKINIFVFMLSIFTVLIFFTSLYHKRALQNQVIKSTRGTLNTSKR